MDKLKYVKLENPDGSYSESIPISAEATNVNVDGDSVETKLNKKPYYYNSVAAMKADIKLQNGDMVITLGYYSANDGGGAEYRIVSGGHTDDGGSYHELNNHLWAELATPKERIHIKQFGAYGDNEHDDANAMRAMYTKYGIIRTYGGTYRINSSITINGSLDINGSINYTGSDYGFIITGPAAYLNIKINSFSSDNGGMMKLAPTGGNYISFSTFDVKYAHCKKECFFMDATDGIITMLNLTGVRWRGITNSSVKLYIGENARSGAFLTEINVKNVDLWSGDFGIRAENSSNNVEIQFNLYASDLENCKGISTTGRITALGIYDCRLEEAAMKNGWLTFNGYVPPYITIQGKGYLWPSKIKWNETSNNPWIDTNLTIIDEVTTYNYEGGGVFNKSGFLPKIPKARIWKKITNEDLDENHKFIFSTKNTGIVTYLQFDITGWADITIPTDYLHENVFIENKNNFSLTLRYSAGARTIASFNAGNYLFVFAGNGIYYTQLT